MLSYLLLFNKHLEFDFFNSIQNSHVPEPGKHVENLQHLHIMHQSIPPAPSSPPGYCGAFARLVSPRGGAFANFALPMGRAFANPRAIPELLTRMQFPIGI